MHTKDRRNVLAGWKLDLEAELAKINKKLVPLEAQRKHIEEQISAVTLLLGPQGDNGGTLVQRKSTSLGDAAYGALSELGKPTHYTDLSDYLLKHGVEVPGRVPEKNLSAHLSRDDRFVRTRSRGVYALAKWSVDGQHSYDSPQVAEPSFMCDDVDDAYFDALAHSTPDECDGELSEDIWESA